MYYDFLVKIPENIGKISKNKLSLNKRAGTTYVEYTYGRRYIPEKRYNVPQRTTIGKMSQDDQTMRYPNPNFVKYFPESELPEEKDRSKRSCCLKIGAYSVIKKIIEDYFIVFSKVKVSKEWIDCLSCRSGGDKGCVHGCSLFAWNNRVRAIFSRIGCWSIGLKMIYWY